MFPETPSMSCEWFLGSGATIFIAVVLSMLGKCSKTIGCVKLTIGPRVLRTCQVQNCQHRMQSSFLPTDAREPVRRFGSTSPIKMKFEADKLSDCSAQETMDQQEMPNLQVSTVMDVTATLASHPLCCCNRRPNLACILLVYIASPRKHNCWLVRELGVAKLWLEIRQTKNSM